MAARTARAARRSVPTMLEGRAVDLAVPSIVHSIARTAAGRPGAVAVESHGGVWTYERLWRRAVAIAAALDELGVGAGDRVLVSAERTAHVVASKLAVMLRRAAYVPVDPAYPAERVRLISTAAAASTFLYDGSADAKPPPVSARHELDVSEVPEQPAAAPSEWPRPDDVAYVIYTSGSTGHPKGVQIEHASLVNYSLWCASTVGPAGIGAPLFGSLAFDHTITSLWPTLASGRRLVVTAGVWDLDALFGEREPYSLAKVTPSHLRFFERVRRPEYRRSVRLLVSGGEALETSLLRSLGDRIRGIRLMNHYGPTETTVGCCTYEFAADALPPHETVPIGKPIWNTRLYLVDGDLRPATGPAELVVAGRGVARGYVGEAAGADRFIDERELGGPRGRAYRTGDFVELLPDGLLLYLGREDEQVKVNGYRIELPELRRRALAVDGVADAAFDVVRGTLDRVEAFVVPAEGASPAAVARAVRSSLAATLPPAVVPRDVTAVPSILLNAHGKCDVAATRRQVRGVGDGRARP